MRAAQIVESVGNYNPDIVTLNEASLQPVPRHPRGPGRPGYHATYASSGTGGQCDDHDDSVGNGFGMAIFSKQPIAAPGKPTTSAPRRIPTSCSAPTPPSARAP